MTTQTLTLAVGERIWLDGEVWQVTECDSDTILLTAGATVRRVAPAALIGTASSLSDATDEAATEPDAVVLAGLTNTQRATVLSQANILARVVEFGRGGADITRAAKELGVTQRTVYRMLARFEERGPAGLVDARLLRPARRSVDPPNAPGVDLSSVL